MSLNRRRVVFAVMAFAALGGFAALSLADPPKRAQAGPFPNTINDPNLASPNLAVTPDEGPLVAPGPAPDIIVLYTGRVQGFVEPCG